MTFRIVKPENDDNLWPETNHIYGFGLITNHPNYEIARNYWNVPGCYSIVYLRKDGTCNEIVYLFNRITKNKLTMLDFVCMLHSNFYTLFKNDLKNWDTYTQKKIFASQAFANK